MFTSTLGLAVVATLLGGCNAGGQGAFVGENNPVLNRSVAVLTPTEGNNVRGTVFFLENDDQIEVRGYIRNLEPNSTHGFHIHEYGDITVPNGTGAGGHYNPEGNPHGLPPEMPRHAGDLGNITANGEGVAEFSKTVDNITLAGPSNPILGRGLIVHASEDTGAQPTGEAGARVAQGVIGVYEPEMPEDSGPAAEPADAEEADEEADEEKDGDMGEDMSDDEEDMDDEAEQDGMNGDGGGGGTGM